MTGSHQSSDFGGELLSTTVKRLLLDRIVHGHYRPGERIVELQLAKELGTSQSPIREALRDLAAIGIVTIHPRRGARVRLPSGKELADVSIVRSEVDALAARLAAELITDTDLAALEALVEEMLTRLDEGNFPAVTEADARFHQIIAQASRNHALERAFDQLAPVARTFITLTLPGVDVHAIVLEHRTILAALRNREASGAAQAARTHQLNVSELLQAHYPNPGADNGQGVARPVLDAVAE
ncbi:MAG: Transcriptional regulator, GntR family [Modestobacter sp.]|jgi:DNA-binding GntR family transcriptional regulator|nr:Transcriptional regulator, GntR family [Modestobacter sp.]MCW2509112.1 Transcriptional regulator, GntR family [Modestobacter sp.]MCW2574701.1 Transcriptional regulator, GntR family [Modestobacter sp.]MCW2619188.1 Transcriptional regulator, GntR family [Modestobacter sp.]